MLMAIQMIRGKSEGMAYIMHESEEFQASLYIQDVERDNLPQF